MHESTGKKQRMSRVVYFSGEENYTRTLIQTTTQTQIDVPTTDTEASTDTDTRYNKMETEGQVEEDRST